MNNKETLQSYNTSLSENNDTLKSILETINNLPEAGSGGGESGDTDEPISILPEGYTELLYIKSSGTQWIKTDIIPSEKTNFEITFITHDKFTSSSFGSIFGAREMYYANGYQLTTYPGETSGSKSGHFLFNGTRYTANILSDGSKQTVSFKDGILTGGNGTQTNLSSVKTSPTAPIYLFALCDSSAGTGAYDMSKLTLYSCIFEENGEQIANYIPALENSTNTPGLYDIVTNKFYKNSGTGEFEFEYKALTDKVEIPEEYKVVLYISSSDKQYIHTGVSPRTNIGFDIDFVVYDQLSNNDALIGGLFGARENWYTDGYCLTTFSSTGYTNGHFLYGSTAMEYVDNIRNDAGIIPNTRQSVSMRNNTLIKGDGQEVVLNPVNGIKDTVDITLFSINNDGSIIEYSTMDLYGAKFYDDDALIRNYIPVVRLSDGEAGLYDTVTKTFNNGNGGFKYTEYEDEFAPRCVLFTNYAGTELTKELKALHTRNITFVSYMFSGTNITDIDLSNKDFRSLTSALRMFGRSSKIKKINLEGSNFSNVTDYNEFCLYCGSLTEIKLPTKVSPETTNFTSAFANCTSLIELDLSMFTYMTQAYNMCGASTALQRIDLSNMTLGNNTDIRYAFNDNVSLQYLDIRKMDSTKWKIDSTTFAGIPANCEIIVKDDAARDAILAQRSDFTNIKTVAEL